VQQVRDRADGTPYERTVHGLASDVVPECLRFGILHHEKGIVDADVVEVVRLAVTRRDQTGPAVADYSKGGHPVLAAFAPLSQMVVCHLVGQQRQSAGGGFSHEEPRIRGDSPLTQRGAEWLGLPHVERFERAVVFGIEPGEFAMCRSCVGYSLRS